MTSFGKRIFRGISILSVRDIGVRVMELLRIVVITRVFTLEEFGWYGLAIATPAILSIFVMPQFGAVVQRFYPEYRRKDERQAKGFIFTSLLYTTLNAVVVWGIAFAAAELIATTYYQKPELLPYLQTGLWLLWVQPIAELMTAVLMSLEKFKTILWADLIQSGTSLMGVVMLWQGRGDLHALILILFFSIGLRGVVCLYALRQHAALSRPHLGPIVRAFWSPLILSSFFKGITVDLPTLILGRLLSAAELGIFQIAEKTIKIIFGLVDPYVNTVSVICINTYQEARKQFKALLNRHFTLISITFMFLTGAAMIGSWPLFDLIYGEEYRSAVPTFLILALYPIFGGPLFYQRIVYSVTNQTRQYLNFVLLSTLFQLPLIWFLTSWYDLAGAAISMVVSRLVAFVLAWAITSRIMAHAIDYGRIAMPFLISLGAYALILTRLPHSFPTAIGIGLIYSLLFWGVLEHYGKLPLLEILRKRFAPSKH